MSPPRRHGTVAGSTPRRGARRAAAVLASVALIMAVAPTRASAHTGLVSSTPADGATLSAVPAAVTLVFEEPVLAQGLGMVATAADGTRVDVGVPKASGATVSAPWPPDAPGGSYRVAWRVVADDGHPITGVLSFSYAGAASPSPASSPPSASPSASDVSASASAGSPSAGSTSASTAPAPSSEGGSTAVILVSAAVVLAALATVVIVVRRRRGGPTS